MEKFGSHGTRIIEDFQLLTLFGIFRPTLATFDASARNGTK
jgi:hypothetical protein